jgi:hypothetical protein
LCAGAVHDAVLAISAFLRELGKDLVDSSDVAVEVGRRKVNPLADLEFVRH